MAANRTDNLSRAGAGPGQKVRQRRIFLGTDHSKTTGEKSRHTGHANLTGSVPVGSYRRLETSRLELAEGRVRSPGVDEHDDRPSTPSRGVRVDAHRGRGPVCIGDLPARHTRSRDDPGRAGVGRVVGAGTAYSRLRVR